MSASSDEGCPKCGREETVSDEMSTGGRGFGEMLDRESMHFDVVSCTNCGYSEFYRRANRDRPLVDLFRR